MNATARSDPWGHESPCCGASWSARDGAFTCRGCGRAFGRLRDKTTGRLA